MSYLENIFYCNRQSACPSKNRNKEREKGKNLWIFLLKKSGEEEDVSPPLEFLLPLPLSGNFLFFAKTEVGGSSSNVKKGWLGKRDKGKEGMGKSNFKTISLRSVRKEGEMGEENTRSMSSKKYLSFFNLLSYGENKRFLRKKNIVKSFVPCFWYIFLVMHITFIKF